MDKKRWFYLLFLLVCFLAFVEGGYTQPVLSQKTTSMKLRLAHHSPATGLMPEFLQKGLNEVEELTEGRIKVECYWNESLLKVKDMLRGIEKGVCNMGWIGSTYYPAELPLNSMPAYVLYVPKGQDVGWIVRKTWKFIDECKELHDEFRKWGQVIWSIQPFQGYDLFTNKKIVRTCQDMSGLRIRVAGEGQAKMVSAVGGRPIFIPITEAYTALEKGTIDGNLAATDTGKRFSFYEVARNVAETDICLMYAFINISLRDVEKMSEKDRKTFFEVGRRVSIQFGDALKKDRDGIKIFMENKGVKFFPFSAEEKAKWAMIPRVQAIMKDYVDEQNAAGRPGTKVMETLYKAFELTK
jgi:TRAP-type transport system periplasmic protein